MRKSLFYILSIAGLASCSDDVVEQEKNVLSGSEKTPIAVVTNLSANYAKTRAVDKVFEGGEELLAYIQAGDNDNSTFTKVGDFCKLETLHVLDDPNNQKYNNDDNVNYTDNLDCNSTDVSKKIFWDDYSNATYPLTDPNRGIRLYYGYCYNGGSTTTDLNEAAGTIGWTVASAPTTETFKKSDLLYAKTQGMIQYNHDPAQRETLVIPYTHAMSKVTIEVICDEGFEADATKNFVSAVVTLKNMNTVCTVTAPTAEVSAGTTSADITMLKGTVSDDKKKCSYTALITPTVMKAGNTLATIEGIDGNNYNVVLSDDILKTAAADASAWSTKLAASNASTVTPETTSGYEASNGGITLPGVNYYLEVTVKKQEITVKATIQDWETVSASGVGVMDFTANITSSTTSGTEFITNGAQFNLWRAITDGVNGNYDEITSTSNVVDKATTLTYSTTPTAGWTASPKIYWPNNSTSYYFRALAKYNGTNYVGFEGEDAAHTSTTDLKVSQGTDLVWGTTADHTGTKQEGGTQHYDKGAAINPRTSEVPMAFDHAMSKISVKLESVAGAEGVNVEGAKISIVNIYDGGTVSLTDGKIVDLTASGTMPIKDFGDKDNTTFANKLNEFCVIPQSLVKDKDEQDRTGATTFYTPNDLTEIYDSSNSSEGTGSSKTYVTSTLTPIYYTDSQAKAYNANLAGHVTTDSDKELAREYTLTEYNALSPLPHASITESDFNNIGEAVKTKEAARPYTLTEFRELTNLTEAQFEHLPPALKTKPAVLYNTQEEVDEYNATLGLVKEGDPKDPENSEAGSYTAEEAEQYNENLGAKKIGDTKEEARIYAYDEYHALSPLPHASITQEQLESMDVLYRTKPAVLYDLTEFQALTSLSQEQFNALPSTMRTRPAVKYTQDEADAYNAKLPGAKSTMDVHHYEKNTSSKTAVAGDIKSNGTKVVLHIMLADNTGYTLNLATCKDSNPSSSTYNQPIYTWERGKHYIYTITLGKEEITFRALIKEWEEVNGGGNATLDW